MAMEYDAPPNCPQWESLSGIKYLNLKRTTCQSLVLIYYNLNEVSFGKFRNLFISHNPILRAYGNGEFLGMAKDICCVEGVFPKNQNIGILTFDHPDEAIKCIESKPELREPHHYGGHDLFVIPLCSPSQSWPGYRFLQVDIYEPKNSAIFSKYMNTIVPIVTCHGGHVISGTTQTGHFMGTRKPTFFFITQWRSREAFFACNAEADNLFCLPPPPPSPVDTNIMTTDNQCVPYRRHVETCYCRKALKSCLPGEATIIVTIRLS